MRRVGRHTPPIGIIAAAAAAFLLTLRAHAEPEQSQALAVLGGVPAESPGHPTALRLKLQGERES